MVLPKTYDLSILVCGDTLARSINKRSRNKTYAPNVLSFPLGTHEGEIMLNVRKAAREASKYDHTEREHVIFLFIHGLLHLKGLDHGATMERAERMYMKRVHEQLLHETYDHRN
jgi:probable rRNA maturation factor